MIVVSHLCPRERFSTQTHTFLATKETHKRAHTHTILLIYTPHSSVSLWFLNTQQQREREKTRREEIQQNSEKRKKQNERRKVDSDELAESL